MNNINAIIAKHKGWKCYEMQRGQYRLQYIYQPGYFPWDTTRNKESLKAECVEIDLLQIDRGKLDGANKIPDYTGDARLYMELFEEMPFPCIIKTINEERENWECNIWINERNSFTVESNVIGTAVCLAYCKLHGLECEG